MVHKVVSKTANAQPARLTNNAEPAHQMSDQVLFILSLSIAFAAIIGVVRFRTMDPAYHPFVYFAVVSLLVEIIVFVLLLKDLKGATSVVYNVFSIFELYSFIWLFHNWGLFKFSRRIVYMLMSLAIIIYIATMPIRGWLKINYLARIIDSLLLIVLSITAFNKIVINERKMIFKNAKFWICVGVIIYYTYFILVNTQYLSFLNIGLNPDFVTKVFGINAYANALVNLLYAVALVWVPRKKNILTPW